MNIPAELLYTKEHEWIKVEQGNVALVDITDHIQKLPTRATSSMPFHAVRLMIF